MSNCSEIQNYLKSFRFSAKDVINFLKSLKNLRVLLIGETIIDEYHFVKIMGKSPIGMHIVAEFVSEEAYAGGILACANHLAGFCNQVELITAIGRNDSRKKFIRENLKPNIIPQFFHYPKAPTIVKRRFVDNVYLSKLFEIYIFNDSLAIELEEEIGNYISDEIKKGAYDLILVLDYGHGLLTPKLIKLLSNSGVFLAVNAQSNTASVGYNPITKYPRANYFCLGEQELQLAFQDRHTDLQILAERLALQVSLPGAVSVTRGWRGSFIFDAAKKITYSTPALSHKIVDTVGAGDALFSITSLCVARQLPLDLVGFIGNAAGSLAIEIIGNKIPIEPNQLFNFIRKALKAKPGGVR